MRTTTIYRKSIKPIADYQHDLLKKPTSKKLGAAGRYVAKGKLMGAEVYTLTLTERATCPDDCGHWDDCYGNNMPFAHRIEHGPEFEERLREEIAAKCIAARKKGRKVLIRLHVLGDFYSSQYVYLWEAALESFSNLYIWGYTHVTATNNPSTYKALAATRELHGDRFAVRWSDQPGHQYSANSEEIDTETRGESIVCPEQTGKTKACTTCALCWDQKQLRIIFKTH